MAATAILFKTGKFAISGAFKILFKRIQVAKILGPVWYKCLKIENYCLKLLWKYVWVKKCIEIREILFKNWKLLFENTYQTHPYIAMVFTVLYVRFLIIGRKLAFIPFTQKIQYFAIFSKLIREISMFWNSIFKKSSFKCITQFLEYRIIANVDLDFFFFFFF